MTTGQACAIIVQLTGELAEARRAAAGYRSLAVRLAFRASDLAKEVDAERRRRFALLEERRTARRAA